MEKGGRTNGGHEIVGCVTLCQIRQIPTAMIQLVVIIVCVSAHSQDTYSVIILHTV